MADATDTPETEAPARVCATCSSTLADGQDWCLECGSAQPGRLGGRPGWRAALTVLAITAVLVGGAGAAAYAALSTDAQRDATAAAPPQATPTVAPAPPVQAPPPQTAPTPTVEAPKTETPKVPEPSSSGDDDTVTTPSTPSTPSTSSGGSSSGTGGGTTTGGTDTTSTQPAEPVAIDLPAEAAKLYDPFDRAAKAAGDPADAIDGKDGTAFELPVNPADGTVRAGLTLSLEKATTLSNLEIKADTPGFTVEVYATKDPTIPPDVLDARWEHVGDRRDAGVTETVELDGKFRHVLLWITEQPADTKVAIPEVQLFD